MSCCGQSRMSAIDPLATGIQPAPRRVRIVYHGNNSLQVRGTYSGRSYAFSPSRRVQLVDAADSRVFLRTRYFRRG